jgi:sugar phosphate isomerase/epimerase
MISRRSFLEATAMATVGQVALQGSQPAAGRKKLAHLGVQAGSMRAALTRDFDGALAQIAAIGYTEIELQWYGGNFGRTPEQLRTAFDRAGLRAPSALVHADAILVGWERHLEAARAIGVEHLVVVNLSEDERQSLADWRDWADAFNRAGERARKASMWVALHNEPQFMATLDGRVPYDEFLARTDPALVALELDVGNMTRAGADPVTYLQQHGPRYRLFHLKDLPPAGQEGDRPLGRGRVDFARILAAVPEPDTCWFFVEHAVDPATPFETIRQSYAHLASLPHTRP